MGHAAEVPPSLHEAVQRLLEKSHHPDREEDRELPGEREVKEGAFMFG